MRYTLRLGFLFICIKPGQLVISIHAANDNSKNRATQRTASERERHQGKIEEERVRHVDSKSNLKT